MNVHKWAFSLNRAFKVSCIRDTRHILNVLKVLPLISDQLHMYVHGGKSLFGLFETLQVNAILPVLVTFIPKVLLV